MSIKITTLIENSIDKNKILINEHGLSLYIQIGDINILFDTGQSGDFIKNAEKLKIDLDNLNYVILSHGHYDHTGGFKKLVEEKNKSFKLIVGNQFFNKKYKLVDKEKYKFNGNSFDEQYIDINNINIKCINEKLFDITEDILVFSDFERNTDYEILNKNFYIKQNGEYISDDFLDEIVLVVKHQKGLIVILGCSHVGLVNILKTIIKRTGMPIYAVIGGSHLVEADNVRIDNTIKFIKQNNIAMLRLSHCTGEKAIKKIENEFPENFIYNNTGNIIELDL